MATSRSFDEAVFDVEFVEREDEVKRLSILCALVFIGGCQARAPEPKFALNNVERVGLNPKQMLAVQASIRSNLKDPDSARFGKIIANKLNDRHILVCGEVNAKNSFGGYTGMTPYVGGFKDNEGDFKVGQIGGSELSNSQVLLICAEGKIFI